MFRYLTLFATLATTPTFAAGLSADQIDAVMEDYMSRTEVCAQKSATATTGRLLAHVTLAANGEVEAVEFAGRSGKSQTVSACLEATLVDMVFPAPDTRYRFSYLLHYSLATRRGERDRTNCWGIGGWRY